jgi:hypothetical protein
VQKQEEEFMKARTLRRCVGSIVLAGSIGLGWAPASLTRAADQLGHVAASSALAGKYCHYVIKKVHGKLQRVKVCTTVKPAPTATSSPIFDRPGSNYLSYNFSGTETATWTYNGQPIASGDSVYAIHQSDCTPAVRAPAQGNGSAHLNFLDRNDATSAPHGEFGGPGQFFVPVHLPTTGQMTGSYVVHLSGITDCHQQPLGPDLVAPTNTCGKTFTYPMWTFVQTDFSAGRPTGMQFHGRLDMAADRFTGTNYIKADQQLSSVRASCPWLPPVDLEVGGGGWLTAANKLHNFFQSNFQHYPDAMLTTYLPKSGLGVWSLRFGQRLNLHQHATKTFSLHGPVDLDPTGLLKLTVMVDWTMNLQRIHEIQYCQVLTKKGPQFVSGKGCP